MFAKDPKIKTETALKNSDRKKLKTEMVQHFPSLTDEDLETLLPKGDVKIKKIYTHNGDDILVYFGQKNPLFFEFEREFFPTVYFLWKYPETLPIFITHPPVFDKLFNGADLMLPGVILLKEFGPKCYGNLKKGTTCAVHSTENKAPLCVGKTALSSEDMFLSGRRGKCVKVIHSFKDKLWAMGDKSLPPTIPFQLLNCQNSLPTEINNATEENNDPNKGEIIDNVELNRLGITENESLEECPGAIGGNQEENEDARSPVEQMDDRLYTCFLQALKQKVKKGDLPLLTSTFARTCLQVCCPTAQILDVKKSSYKKLSKFLQSMQQKGFIEVKELTKGVESITNINYAHPEVRKFVCSEIVDEVSVETTSEEASEYEPPEIVEMHQINAATLPFFKLMNCQKGQTLTAQQVRQLLNDYIKKNELSHQDDPSLVQLDPILTDVLLNKGEILPTLRRDELITRCLTRMLPAYKITFPHRNPEIRKGNVEPIILKVEQRASNKKVTLIQNLEVYDINLSTFSNQLQLGVAASTSISALPGKNNRSQVMVQGNQVRFIGDLLTGKYGLNKKYIEGMAKPPKKSNKKAEK